jgi:hypothetical protein
MIDFKQIKKRKIPNIYNQMNIEKWLVHYRNMKRHFTNPTKILVDKEIPAHILWNSYK